MNIVRIILDSQAENLDLTITKPTKLHIITRYLVTADVPLVLNDKITIASPGVEIDYDCFGVLADGSEKELTFTLDFQPGANNSTGHEKEEILLLGSPKKCLSSPIILCSNPTISGSHGVTLGKPVETELKYLMSRGLSETEAKKLIISSRFTTAFQLAKKTKKFNNGLKTKFGQALKEILP